MEIFCPPFRHNPRNPYDIFPYIYPTLERTDDAEWAAFLGRRTANSNPRAEPYFSEAESDCDKSCGEEGYEGDMSEDTKSPENTDAASDSVEESEDESDQQTSDPDEPLASIGNHLDPTTSTPGHTSVTVPTFQVLSSISEWASDWSLIDAESSSHPPVASEPPPGNDSAGTTTQGVGSATTSQIPSKRPIASTAASGQKKSMGESS